MSDKTNINSASDQIQLFEEQQIRSAWDEEKEEWYFSIVDVVGVLTEQKDYDGARNYWKVLKIRLKEEGSELVTKCNQLKMRSPKDGKLYKTDVADTKQLLRIIQSIPSPKAEPFKIWLSKVGAERLEEIADPEKAVERAVATYKAKGYSDKWISQRLRSIEIRKELTDEWQNAGIKNSKEFAMLTNILTKSWSGKTVQEYKKVKGLNKESLRDNMTNTELALNLLAEVSVTEISRAQNPKGYEETEEVTIAGGEIAGNARKELEKKLGRSVISSANARNPNLLDDLQ
ncbi:MAG: phage antirepressor protein [Lachnospiraceae bacterium]|nr:phage antirepressor protein [Lachnospiraceae bacterium]